MKVNPFLMAAAALLLAPVAGAQTAGGGAPANAVAPSKLGVLSVRVAIVNTAEGKQAAAEMQSQFTPRQTEIENMRKQLQDLQTKLGGQGTDEEKARWQRQGESIQRILQRRTDDLREDLQNAENEIVDRIGRKMMEIVDKYAKENGFSVIFDVSAQTTPVIFASNQVDITQDIIRLHDVANPVKGAAAATAPAPGQPRPRPPAQKPPQK